MSLLAICTVGVTLLLSGCAVRDRLTGRTEAPGASRAHDVLLDVTSIAREYVQLRYRTDVALTGASLTPYPAWNAEMTALVREWKALESGSDALRSAAEGLVEVASRSTDEARGIGMPGGASPLGAVRLASVARAYDREEISNVFDAAPAGKKIATLAAHLGVDARRAWQILQQDQAQVEADAWNEAGDTFSRLETSAAAIKDGCKVAGFVGTIALTGGTAAVVGGSTLAKAAVVVSGADLVLEVSDDAARIALGNHNGVSAFLGDVRSVTEPVSGLLTIVTMPGDLDKAVNTVNAVWFGAEQINSFAQENKVLGIDLPELTVPLTDPYANLKKHRGPVYVTPLSPKDVEPWLRSIGADPTADDPSAVPELLGLAGTAWPGGPGEGSPEPDGTTDRGTGTPAPGSDDDLSGTSWAGELSSIIGGSHELQLIPIDLTLERNGKVTQVPGAELEAFGSWSQSGDLLRLYSTDREEGFYEFRHEGDDLVFVRLVADGTEVPAGADYLDGTAPEGTLRRR
ncbi:MAG: hypothetical protein GXX79_02525 [Actinomycetales bacterium]|nr:hypothetical protein [Actinomycetales bacterium]